MRQARWLLGALAATVLALPASARTVRVTDAAGLTRAVTGAKAGDDIVLADGSYNVSRKIVAEAEGTEAAPITVRAEHRWKAVIHSAGEIVFEVTGPHWTIEDLEMHGVCTDDSTCDHAVHVVGRTDGFRLLHNRLVDFNAQLKVNADEGHELVVDGLVEGNQLFNTRGRRTGNPVVPLDIDNTSGWVVRGNFIADFHKDGGDGVSYAGFIKGGSSNGLFERNLVVCSRHDDEGGTRIGLSFGGGGMLPELCAPHWDANVPCTPESSGGVMRNNIIANCSDVGIYLNGAQDTKLLFNTLVRTQGIDFRYPASTGLARGNLIGNVIHRRDGGTYTDGGNLVHRLSTAEFEAWYTDPNMGDLRLKGDLSKVLGKAPDDPEVTDDFCGRKRTKPYDFGALQSSLGDCPTLP